MQKAKRRGTLVWSPDGGSEMVNRQISNLQKHDRMTKNE